MNGRVYDYNLGRFMSVDPFIQSPGDSQSINPYSYIMNNPLAGTDPTGYCAAATGTRVKSCGDMKVEVKVDGKTVGSTVVKDVNFRNGADVSGAMAKGAGQIGQAISDLGSQKQIAQSNSNQQSSSSLQSGRTNGGGTLSSRKPMPELLGDFIGGRVSFPDGIDNVIAHDTISQIQAEASDYFGLSDRNSILNSPEGMVARTAAGEFNGMRQPYVEAFAWVVRNRVESGRFPDTYQGVVQQRKQFSSWNVNDPNYGRVTNPATSSAWFQDTLSTIRGVLNAPASQNPIPNVLHYYSPRSMRGGATPNWAAGAKTVPFKDIKSNYMTLVEGVR